MNVSWQKTKQSLVTLSLLPSTVSTALSMALLLSLNAAPVAAETLQKSRTAITADMQRATKSQGTVEALDDEYQALLQEYRATHSEIDQLTLYNKQMAAIVDNQQAEIAKIDQQIKDIEFTEQGILPLMSQMVDSLEQFNQLDLPFLKNERETRLAKLRQLMTRADITISEKYRRVLEAFQIEVEYGRTLETYRQKADDNIVYDFLRIGRTALYRLTLNGESAWVWNKSSRDWQLLDTSLLRDLRKAQDVARQTAAPEILTLPLLIPKQVIPKQVAPAQASSQAQGGL